jgi:hypothetical protein
MRKSVNPGRPAQAGLSCLFSGTDCRDANKVIPEDPVLGNETLPKVKMPIGDDYARLPEWKHGTPRLKGYPY